MAKGVLGRKLGMTQVYDQSGLVVPVTVVDVEPNVVVQVKTAARDGYEAIQVGTGEVKAHKLNRPLAGHFKQAGVTPRAVLREMRFAGAGELHVGDQIGVELFREGELVDVIGISKGKGFAGGVKRHHFNRGPMAHGSKYHRGPGSISARMSGGGGHVRKGRRLPGHLGADRVTVRNLALVRVDREHNLLLIKGAVPGPRGALVTVRKHEA